MTGATSSPSRGGFNVPRPPVADIPQACYRIFCKIPYTQNRPMDDLELLTVSQAAEAFNATSQTVRNWIRGDRLRAVRIGNRFLIPREEIERMRGDRSGDRPPTGGESLWDYSDERPREPLRRKIGERTPAADPVDGLLGA
jgi:excisionase family DNA binding protein